MRRNDLIIAVKKLVQAINDSEIVTALELHPQRDISEPSIILGALKKYSNIIKDFNDSEKQVIQIMNLSDLDDPNIWGELVMFGKSPTAHDVLFQMNNRLRNTVEFLPKFMELIKQDSYRISHEKNTTAKYFGEKELLTVILPEVDREFSKPIRITEMIESINLFYDSICILENTTNDLSIISIDSGSDKSFDFLGSAEVIKQTKEIVLSLWDRVVFYREKKLSERIDIIAKSLPVIERINELEVNEKITPEQAEILRRNIFQGASSFIETGSIIPEINNASSFNPRELLAPEQKLLTAPDTIHTLEKVVERKKSDIDNLSDEDVAELKKLLSKSKKNKSGMR